MGGRIKLLPEYLANQIAAGEVVQRPSSVVKELMENAVDAGAKHIKLIVKDGGKTLIQVIDDGTGMDETDARMAFERHATSKISSTEDLFNIRTKGFRGEALASVASVAHVEMRTKPAGSDLGTLIRIKGGKVVLQEPVQTPVGTNIAVKNLFFNVPARRKFLKSPQVEMRHVIDEFQRIALAYPELAFTLIHNGNEVYHLYPGNLYQRITAVFGKKMGDRLLPLEQEMDYVRISGYTGKPEFAKLRRGEQFFFVNKRFVKSPYLHKAVMDAYGGLIGERKIPSYFIFFDIEPQHVDVNIHPTKTEIKFDDEATVYNLLRATVRHALGKFDQMPSLDFEGGILPDFRPAKSGKTYTEPSVQVSPSFNPFTEGTDKPFDKPSRKEIDRFTGFVSAANDFPSGEADNPLTEFDDTENDTGDASFQWADKYIVTYVRDGLLLVHQYRAHVSVLYEEFLQELKQGNVPSQLLMFPWKTDYLPAELELLEKHRKVLEKSGIRFEIVGEVFRITAAPTGFDNRHLKRFMDELLAQLSEEIPAGEDDLNKYLALRLAQASAIGTGQTLSKDEQQKLLARLFSLENPRYAPDGKKNFITLSENEINNRFL